MPFENPLDRKQVPAQKKQAPLATRGRQDTGNNTLGSIDKTLKQNTGLANVVKQQEEIDQLKILNSFTPSVYDYIALGYTGINLTSVVFKMGGVEGEIVSTLTLSYSGANLISVTKNNGT